MISKKIKDGVSVKEIEGFAKKHRFEVAFCLAFLLSCLFNFIFFTGWGAAFASIGGILGIIFPEKVEAILKKCVHFFAKQEETTQLILGVAGLVLSIFLPILTFLVLGLSGGKHLRQVAKEFLAPADSEKAEEHKDA